MARRSDPSGPEAAPSLGPERGVLIGLLALSVGQSFAVLGPAWAVKHLFDQALHPKPGQGSSATPLIVFVVATMAVIAIEVLKRRVAAERAIRHAARLRAALFRSRLEASGPAPSKGSLLLPFVGDLTAARRWQSEGLPRAVSAAVLLPVVIAAVAWQSPPMALAMGAALALSLGGSALLLGPMERAVRDVRSTRGSLTSYVAGRLLAADVVRSSGRAAQEVGKVMRRTERLAIAERRRAWTVGATRGAARLTSALILIAALYTGLTEVARGHLTAGSVAGALTLVGLLGQGVVDLARAIEMWKPAKVSYERIASIVDQPVPRSPRRRAKGGGDGLAIEKLRVGPGVRVARLSANPGSIVLVDGPNGAGKSALLSALAIPDQRAAAISVDGKPLAAMGDRTRARAIGYARNGMSILPGSLRHNLDLRGTGATTDEIGSVAGLCGLQPLIDRLPGGLAGRLREDQELSGSERAGIALARALLGGPALLLLDMIDAELDNILLERVAAVLRQRKGVTLMVARKPEWRRLASVHWHIVGGQVEALPASAQGRIVPFDRTGR